jgi:DMSO/TMAO reductase YedYZ molybdopterin-dependent catalytic subunit
MPNDITREELALAARNHGLPLEALREAVTPVGLHYLLIHYDIPAVDTATWRLVVDGAVERPLSLSIADLRARPAQTTPVTLECAGNGRALLDPRPVSQPWLLEAVGTGEWTGTSLAALLAEAGLAHDALELLFTGLDRGVEGGEEQLFRRSLSLAECLREDVILAYDLNGQPLPPQHGFPLRLVVPGWYGMAHVKWLSHITGLREPFEGYQQRQGYRLRAEPDEGGVPVTRILPRALMVPPGHPDFLTRERRLAPGEVRLAGRAWSGWAPIERVEVSADGGATWAAATVKPPAGESAWAGWWLDWRAEPGEHELVCRARDGAGNEQPLEPRWNLGGYANNVVQRVRVVVAAPGD